MRLGQEVQEVLRKPIRGWLKRAKPESEMKRYEDALDAIVCAWVGIEFLRECAYPLGDETAARRDSAWRMARSRSPG